MTTIWEDVEASANVPTTRLLAEHCVDWPNNSNYSAHHGIDVCESMFTFVKIAARYHKSDATIDDPRTLNNFPLIFIEQFWVHREGKDEWIPIMRMDMNQLLDTFQGVLWHVLSDVFFRKRTDEWWEQVLRLVHLIFNASCFIFNNEHDLKRINVKEYCDTRTINFLEDGLSNTTDAVQKKMAGYRSDEEEDDERGRKRIKLKHQARDMTIPTTKQLEALEAERLRKAQSEITVGYINPAWLFDMDTMMTYFWREAFLFETLPRPIDVPSPDLSYIREWLEYRIGLVDKAESVRFRRMWYDDLIVNDCYRRVFMRKSPYNTRPASREVIIGLQDALHLTHCETFDSIMKKQVKGDSNTMYRLSTDAMFFKIAQTFSNVSGDPCKAVYRKTSSYVDSMPCIYRDAIRGSWVVCITYDMRYATDSFTGAYWYMRQRMDSQSMPPRKGKTDLSVFDKHFKAKQQ